MEKVKVFLAIITGAVAAWWGDVYVFILLTLGFMALDYLTGVLAAGYEHNINSKRATDGLYKKCGFFLLLFLGLMLDIAVQYFALTTLSLPVPLSSPFGLIICAWIVLTEAISITENLSRIGIPIPKYLAKWLKITQEAVDISGGDNTE